jgi:carbon-monoxide dehydrogenase medium subunit
MLQSFHYLAPRTRTELHAILADQGPDACLLAGGTDLLVNIRGGLAKPRVVVDVKKVQGFSGLEWSGEDGLIIHAGATINDILRDERVRSDFALLAACAHDLASYQVRNRATVVGNVVNASPCSDMAPALLCLNARAVISSRQGEREIPFREFFKGVKKTVVRPDEVLERIVVPAAAAGGRGNYHKLKRINGHDLGIVGVALLLGRDGDMRLGISSCAPTPVLVRDLYASLSAEAVIAAAMQAIRPISDVRATREYREHMVQMFVRRLLDEVKS